MAASSFSSSSSVVPRKEWTYDVFLSFRGADTRYNFVEHLYAAFKRTGIQAFKDEEMLGARQPIELVKAIKESRIVVVVFSKNYADSSLCLEELSTIMEGHDQTGQRVLPVFYHVDPNDVRKQKGEFATAFETHEDKFRGEVDKVKKWRDALTAAADLYGFLISPYTMGESAFINKIVEVILADKQPRIDALYSIVVPARKGRWTYDVYINFRGEDTRKNVVDHLYAALVRNGIHVFKDDETLVVGQPIYKELVKSIRESRFAVVVFSKNYANSSFCLEELSTIMECHKQMGQRVLPVFYHVDPSDVRRQRGEFATVFETYEDKFRRGEVDKVNKWRDALTAAAELSGFEITPYNRGESAFITGTVETILADKQLHGSSRLDVNAENKIGKLFVSDKEIGKGSNGTIVLEGTYDARPVAVKRVVKVHHDDDALKEIENLIASDQHPNIVRYYGVEDDQDFVYIALERCICNLHELILSPTTVDQSQLTLLEVESFKVREPIGYPSPALLKVVRETVTGLAHLHELGIIHRDLKPQNVLICKYSSITAKVSGMGISKSLPADTSSTSETGYGSSGWQAPETLRKEPQTRAVDLFGFGCLLFFCITGGGHPFGDDMDERDINIVKDRKDLSLLDNIPEAFDLVSNLIQSDPESRPIAAEVYHHPLFWDPDMRLSFLRDASYRVEQEGRETSSDLLEALESIGTVAFGSNWNDMLDGTLVSDIGRSRKYKYDSVRDLLRVIRRKLNHYRQLPKDVQDVLGPVPTGFEEYFRSQFPKLLMEVYKVLKQYCGEEEFLNKYYYKKRGEAALTDQQISANIEPRGATREKHLVGMEPHIDALISLLEMEATEKVRIVGIWGVRGIGKTTIAQALFDRIANKFEGSSFVEKVRENSSKKDICSLQQKILEDILGENSYTIKDHDEGAKIIQESCCTKKVLLVLDDVNDVEQLEFLADTPTKWFGPGSRIIITTRVRHLLSDVDENYKPATLRGDQAVELFSTHAFNERSPPEGYEELSIRAIRSTGGLPLALEILGSLLHGHPSDVWESALDRLVEIPIKEIYDTPELCSNVVQKKKKGWTYDVFLSFRGRDTLHSFVDSLYAKLVLNGIRVFKDDEKLGGGQTILEEHVKAIKESRFAVVVFSKKYAESSLCLEELSTIMECHDQTGRQMTVLPVFYDVDPSDLRSENGDFKAAFETHEHKFKGEMDKVNKWKDAVTKATHLSTGFSANNGDVAPTQNSIHEMISTNTHPLGTNGENNRIDTQLEIVGLHPVAKKESKWENDVFLSFKREDTGNNFSDHLHAALDQKICRVYKHDYVGTTISNDVVKAIEKSRCAVVVFSKNYADANSWCLKELCIIMKYRAQMRVLPVFYHVHPSDMVEEREVDPVQEQEEMSALTEATNLPLQTYIPLNNKRGESAFVKKIVEQILHDVEIRERKIGKLFVSEEEIGTGSNDTIVRMGMYGIRPVAVKCILERYRDVAIKERENLVKYDHHANIVRYHGFECGKDYIYVVLELCICSLQKLIISSRTNNPTGLPSKVSSFKLLESNGYPSPELLKVMRDTITGLAYLHEHKFIHGDLKPQKVLICNYGSITAKISASKRLPADMSSVSSATGTANIFAEDLNRLGRLLFFCVTGGRRRFEEMDERSTLCELSTLKLEKNIIPEAFDLVKNLIESRLKAAEAYHHPLFWGADMRLSFLHDAFDYLISKKRTLPPKSNPVDHLNRALESIGKDDFGSRGQWSDKVHKAVVDHANNFCIWKNLPQYVESSVLDLLRLIRNYREHHRKLPENIRKKLGDVPTGYEWYFRKRFPNLLIQVYNVLKPHCGEKSLQMYYEKIVGLNINSVVQETGQILNRV